MFGQDQATKLRTMVAQQKRSRQARIVAVASGKGGVGKTAISVNVAASLAGKGRRVVLFDADLGLANAEVLLNVEPACTVLDVLDGRKTMRQVIQESAGGVSLISGGSGVARLADLSEFERVRLVESLEELEGEADIIIVDCGAGIAPNVLSFAGSADMTMIVTAPEPTSLTDAYALIKVMTQRYDDGWQPQLVVNCAASRAEAQEVYQRISRVSWRFLKISLQDAGYVLRDEAMIAAVKQRLPVVVHRPHSAAARCIEALARRVDKSLVPLERRVGFFRRVLGLLT
jgi:flagellar biosynthesis protein FlhG